MQQLRERQILIRRGRYGRLDLFDVSIRIIFTCRKLRIEPLCLPTRVLQILECMRAMS